MYYGIYNKITKTELLKQMNNINNEYLFSSWMLFQQIINDINTMPIYNYTKELIEAEPKADKKAVIIKKHCKIYNLIIKL